MATDDKLTDSQYRVAAMRRYSSDEIDVDDCSAIGASDALVAHGKDGAWVKAWLWVPNSEAAKVEE